ncbi:MAG TPA: hypothetical protein VGZ29_11435 [Terriglobia bacterium]|nr:hypothetical protein [Terriglobia bacterium]
MLSDLQLEMFSLPQPGSDQLAAVAHESQQDAHLFVDRFGRRLLPQPLVLILANSVLTDVDNHLVTEKPDQVLDGVFREGHGPMTKCVAFKILLGHFAK